MNFWLRKKANYQIRKKSGTRHNRVSFGLLFFVVVVLWIVFPKPFMFAGAQIMRPFSAVASWYQTTSSAIPSYIRGINAVRAERDQFQLEIENLSTLKEERDYLLQENRELKGIENSLCHDCVMAGVVATSPFMPYDFLLLDRGRRDGVVEGSVVYRDTLYAYGAVIAVFETQSLVRLFSSPNAKTTVYVPSGKLFTQAEGVGNGVVKVRVPQDVAITIGDAVVLPGINSALLGFVATIEIEPTDPEKDVFVVTKSPLSHRMVQIERNTPAAISFDEIQRAVASSTYADVGFFDLSYPYVKLEDYDATGTATTTRE